MKRMLWVGVLLVGFAGVAMGQANAILINFSQPLTESCEGGNFLPDNTTVDVMWDDNNNGPDETDEPIPLGVFPFPNFNQFQMRGEELIGIPGTFATDPLFTLNSGLPTPSRFWLRICLDGQHWESAAFTITQGLGEYYFGTEVGEIPLTCVNTPCAGCPAPTPVSGFTGTSNSCANITLNWTAYPADQGVDSLFITRNGTPAGRVHRTATSFVDTPAAGTYTYEITARFNDGNQQCFSAASSTPGTRIQSPIAPDNATVSATTHPTECGKVIVRWTNPGDVSSIDSFIVFQDNIQVHRVGRGATGAIRRDTLTTALSGSHNYSVAGWSAACGTGAQTAQFPATAFQPPAQVTGLTASTGLCSVNLAWTAVSGATSYIVRRNGTQIGTVTHPTVTFSDNTVAVNTLTPYTVAAVISTNPPACQEGTPSLVANGSRIGTPNAASSVVASDSVFCTHVAITWADNSNDETGFVVRRDGVNLTTVAANVTSYNDSTAAAGNHTYAIASTNTCGTSSFVTDAGGSKKQTPNAVTGFTATGNLPDRVTLTWNNTIRETGYQVYRNGSPFDLVGADVTSYDDFTATPNTPYDYQVEAFNECGNGTASVVAQGIVPCQPPLEIQGFGVSQGDCDLAISWEDDAYEEYYVILRDGEFRASVAENVTIFVDDQAQGNTIYDYQVMGVNSCFEGPLTVAQSGFRYTVPNNPNGVSASDTLCTEIAVTWQDVDFEDGYIVRRNGVVIGFTTADDTAFADPVGAGVFSYRVQAFNPCGASFNSLADSGHTDVAPTMLALSTQPPTCEGITLEFAATANSDTVKIFRNGELVYFSLTDAGEFSDVPPSAGEYFYSAQAISDCGVSNVIDSIAGTYLAYPAGPTGLIATHDSCETITISWSPATGDYGYYRVLRDGLELAEVDNLATSYDDSTVIGGIDYEYSVIAVNDTCGESVDYDLLETSLVLGSLPAAPEIVIAIEGLDAVLSWSEIDTTTEGCPVLVARYLVYFSEIPEGPFYYHGSTTDTTYRHVEVARFAEDMYYHVETFAGDVSVILALRDDGTLTQEDVMQEIRMKPKFVANTRARVSQ
jgi:hypothetical protein